MTTSATEVDLGVVPYLVASTVEAVLPRRLVRVLCPHCRHVVDPPAEQLTALGGAVGPGPQAGRL